MRRILLSLLTIISIAVAERTNGQGCVAIRSAGGFCGAGEHYMDTASQWQLSMNTRWFKSFRHFIGTEEQKQRQEQQTEVINHQYTTDIAIYRLINPRWSVMLDLPILANTRSSLYEHNNLEGFRHIVSAWAIYVLPFIAGSSTP